MLQLKKFEFEFFFAFYASLLLLQVIICSCSKKRRSTFRSHFFYKDLYLVSLSRYSEFPCLLHRSTNHLLCKGKKRNVLSPSIYVHYLRFSSLRHISHALSSLIVAKRREISHSPIQSSINFPVKIFISLDNFYIFHATISVSSSPQNATMICFPI